jgi:hypothetical protein
MRAGLTALSPACDSRWARRRAYLGSQGCSSCPPAEALLGELASRDDVIALEFHVDYWDYIGWADPFADPRYTARQRAYGRALDQRYIYTPQMVIDGAVHVIGSREAAVEARIEAARMRRELAREAGEVPRLALTPAEGGALTVTLDGPAPGGAAYELLAVGFDGAHETQVRRGENAGRQLTNRHVVRAMEVLARWSGGPLSLEIPAGRMAGDGGCAVLLQQAGQGRIAAARMVRF